LTPTGSWAVAKTPNLKKNNQVQQCAQKRQDDHWDPDPVGMKAAQERAGSGTESNGGDPDGQTKPIEGGQEGADALKESEEEAGPGNRALRVPRFLYDPLAEFSAAGTGTDRSR